MVAVMFDLMHYLYSFIDLILLVQLFFWLVHGVTEYKAM